jgi:hypothetical protein
MKKHPFRRARAFPRQQPGTMNRTEAEYASVLESRKLAGEIVGWRYEAYKLRLADNTHYTPDFVVQLTTGEIELHETKACTAAGKFLCQDDAKVKIKVAAEQYPEFRFIMCGKLPRKCGGGWKFCEY